MCSLGSRKGKSENDDGDDALSETGAGDEESILKAEEKEALRSFTLTSPTADEDTIIPSTDEDEPQCTDEIRTSIDILDVLTEALARSHPESLRHRQVRHMLSEEERKRSVQENFNRQQHLQRIDCIREKGVSTQNAELLPRKHKEHSKKSSVVRKPGKRLKVPGYRIPRKSYTIVPSASTLASIP